jgi:hypothetical protein
MSRTAEAGVVFAWKIKGVGPRSEYHEAGEGQEMTEQEAKGGNSRYSG